MRHLMTAARFKYGRWLAIGQIDDRFAHHIIGHMDAHKAEYMVQRQKRQRFDLAVTQEFSAEHLLHAEYLYAQSRAVEHEHLRRARRARCAQRVFVGPRRRKRAAGPVQCGKRTCRNLFDSGVERVLDLIDDEFCAGVAHDSVYLFVGRLDIDQKRLIARHQKPPQHRRV
ncbi:hypothetical protein SDC9_137925 [bioreactor metagenome]|uniref:Uncharacterized protein n=1 Tax=bioreactor metagenome TaxID=1076179 RepID=A0A645DPW0_9ZZZZ